MAPEPSEILNNALSFLEQSPGSALVTAERHRHLSEEGWTPEHDDEHIDDEMRWAAVTYLLEGHFTIDGDPPSRRFWPWDESWWKPSDDPVRNLVKAGSLIVAEIDRLLRARDA